MPVWVSTFRPPKYAMSNRTLVLLSHPASEVVVTGEEMRVDQRGTPSQFTHTIQIVTSNFVGRVSVEASLMPIPGEEDWFPLDLGGQPYLECREPKSKSFGFTVQGRFIWVRAKVDRSLWLPVGTQDVATAFGFIDRILFK